MGNSLLHFVCEAGNYEMMTALLDNGADVNLKNKVRQFFVDFDPILISSLVNRLFAGLASLLQVNLCLV